MSEITLRHIQESDLPTFFQYERDSVASDMAAFTSKDSTDWNLFSDHWSRIVADKTNINRCILLGSGVVGYISSFEIFGEREVSYWIDRAHWGKGIATKALEEFLAIVTIRPLYARAAKDNSGSRRVLEKCGFVITDEGSGFANARGMEIEEFIFTLRG